MFATRKILTLSLFGAGALLLSAGALRARALHERMHGFGGPLEHAAAALELSDDQRNQIRAEVKAEWPALKPSIAAVVAAHRALGDAVRAETLDEGAIRGKAAALGNAEADLAVQLGRLKQKVAPMLTDAQRRKLDRLHEILQRGIDNHLEMADVILGD